jgi:hypothetical protein
MNARNAMSVAVLALGAISSVASFGLLAYQLRYERSAAAVLIDTASVAQLNGFRTAISDLPSATQMDVLHRNGFDTIVKLDRTITDQRSDLALAEKARHDDIVQREHVLGMLLLSAAFTCAATLLGSALVFETTAGPKAAAPLISI